MYEVAPVAGNKIEAACALKRLQLIMGQISSNTAAANNNNTVNRHHSTRFSKTHYHNRHSAVQPLRKDEIALLRDNQKGNAFSSIRQSMHIKKTTKDSGAAAVALAPSSTPRPVTISEMNAYNIEKNETDATTTATTTTTNETEPQTFPTVVDGNCSSSSNNNSCNVVNNNHKKNEFYTVGDGYHKTDTCYFRSPDGNFHKFPSDSYHKMSEKCYTKSTDGQFRRIESPVINGDIKSNGSANGSSGQMTVKNQMMRFLKRSKSHTPATMKEMQKEREQRQRDRERNKRASTATSTTTPSTNSASHHNHHESSSSHHHHHTSSSTSGNKNNKVVVTMMENGGLPIVATSKASKHHSRDKVESSSDKSRSKTRVGNYYFLWLSEQLKVCFASITMKLHVEHSCQCLFIYISKVMFCN